MEAFFSIYYDRLQAMHMAINKALDGLPAEALNWVPGPEINSIAVLATHTAGSERYWIGDIVGQEPSGRVRAEEFLASAVSAGTLTAKLDAALAHSQSVLQRLTLDQLTDSRAVPGRENDVTVAWALFQSMEHTAQHMAHMELTRQFWEQQAAQ